MRIFGLTITTAKLVAAASAVAASPAAASLAGNSLDKAVIAAKASEVGKAAIDAVHAAEVPGATGAAKKKQAIAAVIPALVLHVAKVGLAATMADLETFAGALIESVLADVKRTGPLAIAEAILQLAVAA
ncbi:hypothetical protein [Sphingomonas bacterium]|uniref:hypothetical protein n=1 Tax=Sphingomonas bacterium TaxID=1895847 RepID=UPI0015768157|nr:hypothetical protein [Sphingomonas bacterium]